jgi:zinc protease
MKKKLSVVLFAVSGVLSALPHDFLVRTAESAERPASAIVAPETATKSELRLPVPEVETLPNGLKVVWFVNDRLPVVDLVLLVKSGFRDDLVGKSGTAELVSNLLDRGAAGLSAQEIAKQVEALGASRFASSEDDTFHVGMHGLAPDASTLLDLLGKMALHPDFPAAEVKREHARILDRWNHISDYGETLVSLTYRRLLTAGTSYGRGNFSSIEEFKTVGRDDLVAYHQKHFVPANSVLMVVGQVDRKALKEKILAAFGSWKGEAPLRDWRPFHDKRLPVQATASSGKKTSQGTIVVVDRLDLTQAQVRIGFRAPLIKDPHHYPLVVANAMLGEYFNSRLNSLIRDKLGLTYSIGSGFSYSKDFASFTVSSATKNESVGQLVKKSIEVMKTLKRGPIPAEELQMAKEYLIGGFPLGTATLNSVASRWLGAHVFELGDDYLNKYIPSIEKVTAGDIITALEKSFDLDGLVVVISGDARQIESSLKKELKDAKLGPVKKVTVRDLL